MEGFGTLIDSLFTNFPRFYLPASHRAVNAVRLASHVIDSPSGTSIEIPVPGIKPAGCSVAIEDRTLRIATPEGSWRYQLRADHLADEASAALEDGVLEVFVPRKSTEKRQLEIGTQRRTTLPAEGSSAAT